MISVGRVHRVTTMFYGFYRRHHRPPTTREVADLIGCRSSHTAYQHLLQAAQRGYLVHTPGKSPAFWPAEDTATQIAALCREQLEASDDTPEDALARRILAIIEGET